MSAEFFETCLVADERTASDGRSAEWTEPFTGRPRWPNARKGWAGVKVYAHNALRIVADTVRQQAMDGISGDMPERRKRAAELIEVAAILVYLLALDAAYDGELTDEAWANVWQRALRVCQQALNEQVAEDSHATARPCPCCGSAGG